MNLIQNLPGELQPFMYAAMQSLNWTSVSAHAGEILNPIRLSSGQASSEWHRKSELHSSDVNGANLMQKPSTCSTHRPFDKENVLVALDRQIARDH